MIATRYLPTAAVLIPCTGKPPAGLFKIEAVVWFKFVVGCGLTVSLFK